MGLIDADKLIELIRNDKIDPNSMKIMEVTGCGLQAQTLNMACDCHIMMIKELPSVEPIRWTPISEGLPPSGEEVIVSVCDESGDTKYNYTSHGWLTTDKEYWIVDNEINNYVVAWMLSPEPYRKEK